MRQRYNPLDVVVLGLYDMAQADNDLYAFLGAFQVSFPILLGTQTTYNLYRQDGATSPFPLDYVIDQDGKVAYANTEYDPEAMTAVIDGLLQLPSPVPGAVAGGGPRLEAWPNPFNPRTVIRFTLDRPANITLDIHDARGRLVRRLVSHEFRQAGPTTEKWDGRDNAGASVPGGLYLAHLRAGARSASLKLMLVQ